MEAAFVDEVLRINARYLDELIDAFSLCPYARPARAAGEIERRVLADEEPALADSLEAIAAVEHDARVQIALLIYPRLAIDFERFDAFVSELRGADQARRTGRAPFALAPFHPAAKYGTHTAAQHVMFFRRAPDPTIQLVRFSAIDAVKGHSREGGKFLFEWNARGWAELEKRVEKRGVSERIADDNFARAGAGGLARMQAVLDDIRADRARSYARFDLRGRTLDHHEKKGAR